MGPGTYKLHLGHFGPEEYPAISPEPWLKFSQAGPHFFKNREMNPIKSQNLKKYLDLRVWGLETTFRPTTWTQKTYQP